MVDTKTAKHTGEASDGLVRTTVRLPSDLHTSVKIAAASKPGWTFQSILIEALTRFIGRRKPL